MKLSTAYYPDYYRQEEWSTDFIKMAYNLSKSDPQDYYKYVLN